MDTIGYIIIFFIIAAFAAIFIKSRIKAVTIFDYEKGLNFKKGKFTGILDSGKYFYYAPNARIQVIDTRQQLATIPGQEILTADNISIKMSLVIKYRVIDALKAVSSSQDYCAALYTEAQTSLRTLVSGTAVEDLLNQRHELNTNLYNLVKEPAALYGLELFSVEIKDIMFPGEMKKIFGQVVNARKEGQAALERARGETAALRNLANAARIFEGNPNLLTLRLIQTLSQTSGNAIVLNTSDTAAPLIKKE